MAQLQTLSLAFGETEDKAIELSRGRIGTLVSAISTPKDGSTIGITKDADGNSLLSGYVKSAHGETMLESNKYLLEKNNLRVVGEVQRERYRLNLGGLTNVYEGNDVQVYCQNEDGVNVSMQSMVVWIYADFAMVSKSSDLYNDSDIMAQFNVVRGADDYGWINLGNGLWRATLADSMGMLKIAAPTSNYSWTLPCYLRAYPASIDENETTTDAEREARLTEPLDFVAQAIAVTDATISCSKEENIQAGDMLVFRVGELLPVANTKVAAMPTYSVLFNASEGAFDGASYQVPDTDMFTITALVTYMGMQIPVQRQFMIDKVVLTQTSNAYVFGVVRDALGLPSDTTGITNKQCSEADATQVKAILTAFTTAQNNFTFDEGKYFTRRINLDLSQTQITKCVRFTLNGVESISVTGDGNLFYSNTVLEYVSMPNLESLTCSSGFRFFQGATKLAEVDFPKLKTVGGYSCDVFYNCSSLKKAMLPSLTTIRTSSGFAVFYGCSSLEDYDLSSLERMTWTSNNYIFQGCSKLYKFDFPSLTDIVGGNFRPFNNTTFADASREFVINLPKLKNFNTANDYLLERGIIRTLDLPSLESYTVANSSVPFSNSNITTLSLPKLKTYTQTGDASLTAFVVNSSCKKLELPSLETFSIFSTGQMANALFEEISLPKCKTMNLGAFSGRVFPLTLKKFSAPLLEEMYSAHGTKGFFYGCASLTDVDLSSLKGLGVQSTTLASAMANITCQVFTNCTSLREIAFPSLERLPATAGTSTTSLFSGCTALEKVTFGGNVSAAIIGAIYLFAGCTSLAGDTNEMDFSNYPITDILALSHGPFYNAPSVKKVIMPQSLRTFPTNTYNAGFQYGSGIRILDMRNCNKTNLTQIGWLFFGSKNNKPNLCFAHISQRSVPSAPQDAFDGDGARFPIFVPSATFATYRTSSGWSSYYDDYGYNTMLALYNQWLQNGTTKSPWALDAPTWAAGLTANSTIWLDEEGNSHAKPYWEVPMIQDGALYFGMSSADGQWQNTTSKGQIMMFPKLQYYLRGDGTYLEFPAGGAASSLNNFFYIEGTHDRFLIRSAYRNANGEYSNNPYYWALDDAGSTLQRRTSIVPSCYWKYNESDGSIENLSPSTAKKYIVYNAAETLNSSYVFHLWSEHIGPRWSLSNAYNNLFRLSDGTLAAQTITQATIDAHKAQNNRLFPDTWMKWMCEGYMRDVDGNALSYDTINGWINEEKGTTGVQYDLEDMSGNLIYEKLG